MFRVKNIARSVTANVKAGCNSIYDQSSRTRYNFKVIDTVGVFDPKKKNDDVMTKMKNFFQNDSPEGINLVLFAFRKGRLAAEEKRIFDYIMANFNNQLSDISALVLTHCDAQNDAANQDFPANFKREARDIIRFVKKGIYMVGFPDVSTMRLRIREALEEEIKEPAEMLQKVVMKADKSCLGKETFKPTQVSGKNKAMFHFVERTEAWHFSCWTLKTLYIILELETSHLGP